MEADLTNINPLSGLEWSPTWYPVSVSHRPPSTPSSIKVLSMAAVVIYPNLVEEICQFLPPSLRRGMLAMSLEHKMNNAISPLFCTWAEPFKH